jgi:hypothetical protein
VNARFLAAILVIAPATGARGQDRPSEDELFGSPPATQTPGPERKPASPAPGGADGPHGETEAELFGSKSGGNALPPPPGNLISRDREDWLRIGGQLQLRAQVSAYEETAPPDWPLVSPNLLDVYLDTRPNDRVRGFALGRLFYDPTVGSAGQVGRGTISPTGFGAAPTTANPGGVLDQLWINFDVHHRVFVTAGRQHVKWGVGRFWNPTDFLHPIRRDPLATFDARTGTTMVKVHVPWEKRGWNLYGVAMLEDLAGDTTQPTNRLGRVGLGGRAEVVLGTAELGLDAIAQDGHHPRYGLDLSAGLGDFDIYSEAALRWGPDGEHWVREGPPPAGPLASLQGWVPESEGRLTPQVVVGATWAYKYSDEDSLTIGAEYFYNQLGYDDPSVYPFLLLGAPTCTSTPCQPGDVVQQDPKAYQPFYVGKHYAAVNLTLPRPGSWNDSTLIFSVLGNLSDRSYVARLDASVLVLTYLTVETFVAGHFGQKGGEFRLAVPSDLAALAASQSRSSSFPTGAPLVDLGVALRVSL